MLYSRKLNFSAKEDDILSCAQCLILLQIVAFGIITCYKSYLRVGNVSKGW